MPNPPTLYAVFEERGSWELAHPALAKIGLGRFLEDEQSLETIMREVKAAGVSVIPWRYSKNNLRELLNSILADPHSILWNLTDGQGLFRGSYFPAFVQLAGIPNIGSGSYAQMLCQNKHHLKAVVASVGVRVTRGILFSRHSRKPLTLPESVPAPYFVKPANFDNSIGDNLASPVCEDAPAALKATYSLFSAGIDDVLVEEYLPGEEFSFVALNGGEWVFACPQLNHAGPGYFSSATKDAYAYSYAHPETPVVSEILAEGSRLASILQLQDYYRADFRLDSVGLPRLLEINTNPFLVSRIFDLVANRHFGSRPEMFRQMICQSYARQSTKSA